MHWRRKWQPTPVFLPGESQGWGSLVGCRLWGRTESDKTEATWQQQQFWIFIAASCFFLVSICRLLIVIVLHCGAQALGHSGFSSCGMWAQGSMAQAHGLNCSVTWGIFVDQGWNPFLLLWQADSLPLSLWGSPEAHFNLHLIRDFFVFFFSKLSLRIELT